MSVPASRDDFSAWCLRSLGAPVINIDVSPDQVDDRIDEALKYFWDYHFEGADKTYYKYQITQEDKDNKYITMPANIIGAVNIFPLGWYMSGQANMFNVQYQIALNDLYTLTQFDVVPFYMMMQHLNVLQEVLVGVKPIRFNRHRQRLYVDMDWNILEVGMWIVVEAYEILDPDLYTSAWADRWLARYATALIKRQWGSNLLKFDQIQLPGGTMLNGQKIYDQAIKEIEEMEHDMIVNFSLPVSDMIA